MSSYIGKWGRDIKQTALNFEHGPHVQQIVPKKKKGWRGDREGGQESTFSPWLFLGLGKWRRSPALALHSTQRYRARVGDSQKVIAINMFIRKLICPHRLCLVDCLLCIKLKASKMLYMHNVGPGINMVYLQGFHMDGCDWRCVCMLLPWDKIHSKWRQGTPDTPS